MAAKLSKRDITRLGAKFPAQSGDTSDSLSNTIPTRTKKGLGKKGSAVSTRAALSSHVANLVHQQSAPFLQKDHDVEYPEWIEVRLENTVAVPKERQRFGKGFVYTSKRTREFESILKEAGTRAMGNRPLLLGPTEVDLTIFFPIPKGWTPTIKKEAVDGLRMPTRRMDLDNYSYHSV